MLTVAIILPAPSQAAPPYQEFIEGLRGRRYFDMALLYLDKIEQEPNLPEDVKNILDYERAVTLIAQSRAAIDPATTTQLLDQATAAMERFVNEHPDHPLVAQAQTERGNILIGKAKVAILEANSPGNEGNALKFQEEARGYITEARKIFESARTRYEEIWKSYGPFVDEQNVDERRERNNALNALIQSRLSLAECTYREAQSYPKGDAKNKELLNAAAAEYEAIHTDHRSQVGGLYAHLWRAKCFEEQAIRPEDGQTLTQQQITDARQMLNIAEAIYTELLGHDTSNAPAAARMQEYAFWFKLIVRNHPALTDHQLVVNLATEWLQERRGTNAQTSVALGVRWERAQAYESLSKNQELEEGERERLMRSALADAEFVNSFPGEFRDVSRAMIQRLKAGMGRSEGDPTDFDSANGLAQTLHNQISAKQDAIKSAKTPEEKQTAQDELTKHLNETARILRLALTLATPGTDRPTLNGARYRLAYAEYLRGNLLDAAVLGTYLGMKFKDESPQIALDASFLGMASFYKLYDQSKGRERTFALEQLQKTATFITDNFPDSEQANESRMMIGRLFMQADDFEQAAEWFSKIPAGSAQARESRLMAGRAFWDSYVTNQRLPEESRPDAEVMTNLRSQAEKYLREGLQMAAAQIPADAAAPEELLAGKATLAQIINLNGQYQEAIDLLSKPPHAVVPAVAVKDGAKRPTQGVQSAAFATLVHQQMLRGHIGLQQMEPAIEQMRLLESIGGEGNTAVFVDLGRQIKDELEQMPQGAERDAVMSAFDQFLGKLSEMQQGQTFGSLIWIGETYFGLAEAAAEPKRSNYFDQAAKSYETILSRASESGFLPSADSVAGVRLRLAAVKASRGDFEGSYALAKQVVKQMPRALNAQVETAKILQLWGASGDPEHMLMSIQGDSKSGVWGWGQIAQRLQRATEGENATDEFRELYRQSRYEIPAARREYANLLSDGEKNKEQLQRAMKEITTYAATTPQADIGSEWWAKLSALYQTIQTELGIAVPEELQPAEEYVSVATPAASETAATDVADTAAAPKAKASSAEAKQRESSSTLPMIFGLVLVGGALGGAALFAFRGKNSRRPIRSAPDRLPSGTFNPPTASTTGSAGSRSASTKPRVREGSRGKPVSTAKKVVSPPVKTDETAKRVDPGESPRKPVARRVSDTKSSRSELADQSEIPKRPKAKRQPEQQASSSSDGETPKVVKPRAVKNVRRTKPPE